MLQQHFLRDFGGQSTSEAMLKMLHMNPLEQPERRTLFHALNKVPHLGPPSAWAITERFGSLGNLMTSFMDPNRSVRPKRQSREEQREAVPAYRWDSSGHSSRADQFLMPGVKSSLQLPMGTPWRPSGSSVCPRTDGNTTCSRRLPV